MENSIQNKLLIYNSLSGKKELFEPIVPNHVGMYACGPTLYNEVHLGNLRTFISFDVVFRYLKYLGYKVRYVRNITDVGHLVDDADHGESKIDRQARLENIEPMEVVQKYAVSFREIQRLFNMLPPSIEPTATGHIIEQLEMIQTLLANGFAYEKNGSVYFNVRKYNESYPYGILSGRKIDELLNETRELDGMEEKNDLLDFALWKRADPEHIMRWNSPWGAGFPGWHIECSAMGKKYLGEKFDIHGGGMDLKFPHHEGEIAQSTGACGHAPVNYWMHSNMLTVNGVKMSKSKGNSFLPIDLILGSHELLEKGYSPMTIRFFMMMTHYRSTLDFSNEALQAAEKGYQRLMNAWENVLKLENSNSEASDSALDTELNKICSDAYEMLNDDFNTAMSLATLFELANKINSFTDKHLDLNSISASTLEKMKFTFQNILSDIMGIYNEKNEMNSSNLEGVMKLIIDLRQDARNKKDFATSDKIRDTLKEAGIQIKDGKEGVSWELIS